MSKNEYYIQTERRKLTQQTKWEMIHPLSPPPHPILKTTGLQPVSRSVEQVPYFEGWGVGAKSLGVKAVQTERQTQTETTLTGLGC